MNTGVETFVWVPFSILFDPYICTPRGGITGFYGNSMLNSLTSPWAPFHGLGQGLTASRGDWCVARAEGRSGEQVPGGHP